MLVSKKHKRLVLNLSNMKRVTTVIPTARPFDYRGRTLVAVPHKLDEVRVLRNLGLDAPGPIRTYYDWPGRYTPFTHQIDTADFLTLNPRAFCLNDMGTGKTLSALWAYDFLRRHDYIDGSMLVIGPLSTLERTWADEVLYNFPHLTTTVIHGGTVERRLAMIEQGADVLIVNHDGIKNERVLAALVERVEDGRISVVLPDELAAFRNQGTDRWKALRQLTKKAAYVWGLTGTPVPNEPTDAFGQIKLITPGAVTYYNRFRDATMKQLGKFRWVAREGALDYVYSVMQPSIRFNRKDCIDLPPTTYQTREVELTDDQDKMYKQMLAKFKAEFEGGQITAFNEAAKRLKLLQIVCGVAYSDSGDVVVPARHRLELVEEVVEEAAGKVIVFVPFRSALEHVAEHLRKRWSVAVVHGGIPKAQRDETFGNFQRGTEPQVIVAQPATMSHGLTLTAASVICWFAPIDSNETYEQANARIVRPGQKRNTVIVHIEGSAVERRIYNRLQQRGTTQGVLLEMFEGA